MPTEGEYNKLKNELDDFKKDKIIMRAKLKQKEDKITDLTKKIQELSISSKESMKDSTEARNLSEKIKLIEDEIKRSRKINQDLRNENSKLTKENDNLKKQASSPIAKVSGLEKVALPGDEIDFEPEADPEEIKYMNNQLTRKDEIIARLSDQVEMLSQQSGQFSGGYMKTRKLNEKIRELKGQIELAKKSEASMKERFMEMQRKSALKDEELKW